MRIVVGVLAIYGLLSLGEDLLELGRLWRQCRRDRRELRRREALSKCERGIHETFEAPPFAPGQIVACINCGAALTVGGGS